MNTEMLEQLLNELKYGLAQLYGRRLVGVYLFGSYARGEQDVESDLDILIVLSEYKHYGIEIEYTGDLISKLSLKYDISISRKFVQEIAWLSADTPLLRNIRAEAVTGSTPR